MRRRGKRPRRALAALALLGACTRPLSDSETALAGALFGATLDPGAVRIAAGVGLVPPAAPAAAALAAPRPAPPDICRRTQSTRRVIALPSAVTLGNTVFFKHRYYLPDAARGFPAALPLPASLILVHELVHVWQWQNRAETGYTILGVAGESLARVDPYWWQPDAARRFATFGYEQQAAIVEDFACLALFDRQNPRLAETAALLQGVLPTAAFLARLEARP